MPRHSLRDGHGTLHGLTLNADSPILACERLSDTLGFLPCMFSNQEALYVLDRRPWSQSRIS